MDFSGEKCESTELTTLRKILKTSVGNFVGNFCVNPEKTQQASTVKTPKEKNQVEDLIGVKNLQNRVSQRTRYTLKKTKKSFKNLNICLVQEIVCRDEWKK